MPCRPSAAVIPILRFTEKASLRATAAAHSRMRSGWFWFKESRYTTQLKKLRSVDAILEALFFGKWCPGAELNHRHLHFQCSALPTELPGRSPRGNGGRRSAGFIEARFPSVQNSRPPPHIQDAS